MKQVFKNKLEKDFFIVVGSILVAFIILEVGIVDALLREIQSVGVIASFTSGIFFTSIFTIAPASLVLVKIATFSNPVTVALFGALGAMVGDLLVFFFVKHTLADDLVRLIKRSKYQKIFHRLHFGVLRFVMPVVGGLIIASPLPDEIGLAILGVSKIKTIYLIPIALIMNFLGILGLVFVGGLL
jgi:uncharacterized membrane protein YdjX (TVP38/TMEM64 family)